MKKEDLKNIDNTVYSEGQFITLKSVKGYVITDWNNGDIKEFCCSAEYDLPIMDEYADYYTITQEKADELEKLKETAFNND